MARILSAAILAGFAACASSFAQDGALPCDGKGFTDLHLLQGKICVQLAETRFPWSEAAPADARASLKLRLADPEEFLRIAIAAGPVTAERDEILIAEERFGAPADAAGGGSAIPQIYSREGAGQYDLTGVGGIAFTGTPPASARK